MVAEKSYNFYSVQMHMQCVAKSKFANTNGYDSQNMHFWPHDGMAKMGFDWFHVKSKLQKKIPKFTTNWVALGDFFQIKQSTSDYAVHI